MNMDEACLKLVLHGSQLLRACNDYEGLALISKPHCLPEVDMNPF
jgi:hypothetical protein